jgi:ABC-2 type transport system permease protein
MFERIYSQVFKGYVSLKRNTFRLTDIFVWPLLYLFPLTFFVTYLGTDKEFLHLIIMGMIGWRMVYFINHEIVGQYIEEYWSKSLPHLLISPITRLEIVAGAAVTGIFKTAFVTLMYLVITFFLYDFYIADWAVFLLAMFFLMIVSLSLGLFILGIAFYIKIKGDAFNVAFIIPDAIVLLSGVYFSIESVYPEYMIPYIRLLPTTHAFDLLKSVLGFAEANLTMLALTTAIWFLLAYLFNGFMYNRARKEGKLTRLG